MDTIISVHNLTKKYGSKTVVNAMNLTVTSGTMVGLLGPNGSGKTTTIRLLMGLLFPTSGQSLVLGMRCDTQGHLLRSQVGYLPGDVHLYGHLTGHATLEFLSHVRGKRCTDEYSRLASRFDLDLKLPVRKYSTGMRQKLGLIQALMHRPNLLILDEPTSALDPLVRTQVVDELRQYVAQGGTVLFSSHSLHEVEELCEEVIVLRNGKTVEQQSIAALKSKALRHLTLVFQPDVDVDLIKVPAGLSIIDKQANSWVCTWDGESRPLLSWLATLELSEVYIVRPNLSDLFLAYYDSR
ncbi:MAG: ABC transporter ATP-binding protein [Planctomycetales bacterium]|nr:ABC transporter ATP-binding protein [Planctomycetales bacterium]